MFLYKDELCQTASHSTCGARVSQMRRADATRAEAMRSRDQMRADEVGAVRAFTVASVYAQQSRQPASRCWRLRGARRASHTKLVGIARCCNGRVRSVPYLMPVVQMYNLGLLKN